MLQKGKLPLQRKLQIKLSSYLQQHKWFNKMFYSKEIFNFGSHKVKIQIYTSTHPFNLL